MDDFYVDKRDDSITKVNNLSVEENENSLVFFVEEWDEECQIELEKSNIVELITYLQAWLKETENA